MNSAVISVSMSIFCSINLCTHHNEEVIYSILVVTLSYACIPCNQQIPLMLQSCIFTRLLSSGEFICQFCKYIGQSFVPAHCTQHKDKMCTKQGDSAKCFIQLHLLIVIFHQIPLILQGCVLPLQLSFGELSCHLIALSGSSVEYIEEKLAGIIY